MEDQFLLFVFTLSMSPSFVSIIIPCYNAENWISEAIQSALDQTWPHKEVIVIDDGSKDGSLTAIKKFESKIRWESGPNRGGCAARNRGIALARGEWIQFLDADDLLTPTCVEDKIIVERSSAEVTCSCIDCINPQTSHRIPTSWRSASYDLEYMIRTGSPQTGAPLHRLVDLKKIGGFREELPCAQEFDLHLRLAVILGLKFIPNSKTGVMIRVQNESVSRAAGYKMFLAMAEVLGNLATELSRRNLLIPLYADAIAQRMTYFARGLWRKQQYAEARIIAARARQISPNWYTGAYKSKIAAILARAGGFTLFEICHSAWRRLTGGDNTG